eukprot:g8865.t1
MPASADPRRTPQDPWEDLSRGSTSSSTNKRAHSSASDYKHHPRKRGAKGLSLKHGGASRQRESEVVSLLAKYEASLGRALNQRGKPGSHSPAMDVWALALGVDIEHSKATDRARRKVELEEAGHSTEPGGWTPSVPPTTAPYEPVSGNRRRKRGQDALMGSAGSRRNPVVPEVTALDGFLSDLQQRLESLEGGAVSSSHSTVVPTPASSAGHKGGNGRSITRTPKRTATSASIGGRHDEAGAVSSASLIDVYGIPQGFVANAEEARRQWDGHQANLEKRDEEFLDRYKRGARMSGVQVSIAKAWRGFIFRRKFLAWKGRRQWSMKRSVFAHWSEIVEEDRNTRAMGELSFQAAVSSTRLSRQAVVQFFQDLAPSADDLSPAVLRNKSSVKRRILKILFQSWRNAANLKQKAAAQAAFKVNRAVRLHTASAMLWAPEIVSLLFHVWSRMTRYKKAVREEREPPTFLPEDGYTSLPEWDAWVANKGRHLELKRNVIHIGGQIFLRNKFRRWVWFTKWSLSQEDRALVASQHFDTIKMTKVFTAWAGVCRDRGSMLRRITRCWQGWSGYTRKRKKTSMLKKKTMEHLRLLRTGSVMNDITAYARDGKVLSAFAVSKLLLTKKCFGGLALSYVATGRATQLFWLLAWQAWKKYTTKRRRWKWLLYEHTRTEALHSKYAVFRAWSYATGRRYRPDAASLTLSASLPFSTWDRFVKNYVDQGVIPAEQLRKDMIDQVVMQQHTAWWLLGQTSADDANLKASGPGTGEGGSGRPSGRMELPQSGGSGGGVLGKLGFPGVPGGKGPADTDWQALTPALFAAVDECDTAAVTDLLRRGAQVNSVYVPPKVASTAGAGASRKKAAIDKQDEGSSTTGGTILEAGRALDLPPPALIGNSDGTFEMRGTTPLHAAAGHLSADFTSIVITLLHAGACVDARDANGRTPLQVCTSPQTAALLNEHAARLQQFRFSAQELRWGQQVLTSSRSSAGASGVWRYVIRAAVISRLDKLRATLRAEDARADDVAMEVARRLPQQQHPGLAALCSAEGSGAHSSAADVGLDEREKELIRMKMERLDAVKTIIDREHALHSGTAGAPSTSGGGGGGGAGGSAQDMKNLFHDLDKIVTLRASEKEAQGAPPGSGNPRGGNTRRSIGVSTTDHARSNTRTGKERTADDHRKAFSARRADAASWFRAFREDLARADMLRLKAEIPTSSTGTGSTAGAQASDVSVAKKVLAIVRDAGGGNRNSGAGAGRGGGGGNGHGRLNSTVLGGGAGGGGMLGRGGNTSGTDAFTMTEVNICYMALGSVLDERKSVMDQRAARDNALIERGNWVGLQRAMEASKHGQHDVSGNPSSKRRKNKEKRAASSRSPPPTTAASDSAGGSATVGPSSGTPTTDTIRYGCLEGFPEDIAQDKAPEELAIDVIPTSSSKRCHSASVVLRSTVDSEVLGRAHRTITAWKRGRGEHEGRTSAGKPGTFGWPSDGPSCTFGQGIMSRVPPEWWGQGGERVLTLMLEERRKLRHKGATLTAQAKELEDHLASKSENLQQLYGREHEVGTTVRDVAMETKKSETRFREDMERWQAKIQQAHRKIRAIAKRRTHIADQTAQLEDTLANWDTREIPTASERTKKKKSKDKEEEVTPETLRRDIDAKRELMMSLSAKEKQSVETIENARVQLEESRVYLLRIQSILMKYASYNMGKMDTLEREFQECTRQQDITKDRQRILRTQLQALFKRLAELDKAISILRPLSTTVATETARRDSATEDKLSVQGDHDTDEEVSPSTSRRGSNRSTADNEADARSSKRKRSSGSTTGGRQDESTEGGTKDDLHENSRKRTNHRSSSRKGAIGSSLVPRTSSKGQREEAMASLLVLIDENTAVFDTDMCSLDSAESASTASGAKRKNRQGKRRRTTSSSKTTTTTDSSSGGTTTASTASKTNPKPITIPPSPAKEGEADPLTPPAAWPAESTPGAPVPEQPTSAFYASVSAAASPVATSVRSSSPKSRRRTQRKGSPSPLQKVIKTKKKLKASPRGGKSKTEKGGRQASASTTTLVAEAEAAKQLDQEQPGKEDDRALDCPSVLLAKLEEENRQAEIRAAQEAKELAEEEECRRLWDEEDAEELEAWRARREAEEVLERSPVLSKEDTVRLLTAEYDQALKQTFEPERRAELARRIALVEAEQRDKERKAESVRHGGERTSKDLQPDGRDSNSVEGPILDEQAGDISHLLDDPGLGLTREEIETLFDIVDEGDWGPAKRMVCRGAEDSGGGGNGGDDGATGKRHSRPGVRHADRGLILFLRKRGLRRMASTDPLENPIDVLNGSPRPRPALKPELDDYMVLNFVGGGSRARESDENGPSATTKSNKPGTPLTGGGGDGDQTDEHTDDDSSTTVESVLWRGRGNKYKEGILSHGALNILEPAKADDGDAERLNGSDHDKSDAADRMADGDETHLYPRTLGSSVSVLDEKDAVLRTGGQRFAGEDPIRGRLRATDPFLWMGRLNAGTSAISGLIDKASDALKDLDGGSGGSDCDSSDGRSSDHQRVDRMQDIQSGGRDVVGPSSRGGIAKSQHMGKLSSTAENFSEGDGAENDSEEDAGEIDRSCASAENLSGSGNIAVDLLSSTMSAYSQSMEVNKVIAGGVVIEEEEENSDREQSIHSKDQDNHPTNIHPAGQRKGPAAGSGPCPMRASPVNARSAALGSSAKLRNKHTGVGKAKMTTPGSGLQTWCNSTEETTPTGGREDWGEDESQDIQFDVIVSGIARDVASRAPPTPRQSGEAVGVDRTHVVRPSWSAQERASPTRRQSDGSIPANMDRKRRRPRSTPAGLRARTEAASAVLDKRPPWSLPLDSVFAPRVKGVVQTNIVTASPRRRFSEADGLIIGERNGQGAGRRIGSAPEKGFMTDDDGLLADEPPQDIRRCHSASEALLESGLLQEAPLFDDAPGATDGIWSWGWHDDGAQDIPSTAAPRDTFTPLLTPELCKRSGRLGHRGTAPLRKKDRSRDTLPFEKPLSSRAPSLLRCSRNRLNPVNSNVSHGEGKIARPWTTGELADNDVSDGASAASMGGILKYEGGLQNRARSAGGINSPPGLGNSNLRASAEHSDGALDLFPDEANALASSAEGVSEKGDFFGTIHDDGQEKPNGGDGIDGAAVDGDDCENSELPVVLSPQMPRRVSFADEQGNSDGSGGSTEEPDGQEQHRARRGFQRRRMSSIIGNSEGYLTGDGSINNDLVGNDGRRKSDLERCRRAMEIARVAHDLLFLDTRPDGLRPITGTPMTDGRNAQGSGGLYVGLAGLRGFDLSFVGAVPTSLNDSRNNLGSVAARLAASRRLSAYAAATNRDEGSAAGGPRPSSPDAKGASSSKSEASWIAQGFLLDRKPGSLMPKLPLSAGRAPAAEMGQLSPTQNNSSNSEVDDEGGSNLPTSETAANNQKSPKVPESNSESPLSPVSSSDVQRAPHSATEDGDNAAKYSPSSVPLLAKGGTPQTPDAPDGRELIGLGGGVRCEPSGGDRTRREMEGKTMIPAPKVPSGTTVMSKAATAMASLFAPKAAVLWSARDLGVDELVFSVAGDEEVRRPPGSRDYTSRALLAAYKQASPVFEVEASGWSKHDGAVAGVDYPLQPPDGWGGANSDFGAGEKDASTIPDSERQREKPKAGKTSLHYPRQPVSVSTMEMNGATGARPAPSVTDSGTIEEIQAIMTPAAGGGPEESNPTTDDGAWLERAGRLMVRTAAPDPMVDCLEIPSEASGHKGKCCTDARSSQEEGVSSSGSGFNNGKRTIGTGEGTPNSPGCGASSRGSKHGDRNARGSPSPQTEQTIFEDLESGSNGRSSGQPESKPRYDVSGISLPALGKPEVMEAASNAQQDTPQHSSVAEENDKPTAMMSSENVSKPHKLPHISGAGGGRNKAAGVAGENTAQHAIKVYSRPARMESKDLQTTTEALTTHHLTIDELLKVGYDELLDDSEDENDAGDQRVKIRKEPLMIPHGARVNGMAYWQEREAKERKQRRRPRTAAPDHASMGDELRAAGASAGNGGGGGDVEGPQAGGDGQWEDEKEEIKRLLLAARARREAAVARVRAQREQARLDSERVTLGQMDGSTAATATTVTTTAPEQDESGSAAVVPVRATEKSPTKLMPTSVGGVATADVSGRGGGQLEKAALTPSNATISGEVRRDRSEEASGEAPPWKGFTLSDDGEAMLRRGRIPSPERQSPVEGVEDWEYQLIVPGAKDNLVNFSVDTAAVRTNFGKLRRGVEIRQRLGFDEEHEDYHSDNESQEGDEKGDQSTRSASATGDNEGNNLSDKRRSVFSAERRGSRSASTDRTGAMPDILVRRRSRVAGVGDNSNMVGSPPTHDPGAIARASRLIAELEQDHAGLEFPLDVLRRDSEGFAPDNNSDE